jgi:hypothetical protein
MYAFKGGDPDRRTLNNGNNSPFMRPTKIELDPPVIFPRPLQLFCYFRDEH